MFSKIEKRKNEIKMTIKRRPSGLFFAIDLIALFTIIKMIKNKGGVYGKRNKRNK